VKRSASPLQRLEVDSSSSVKSLTGSPNRKPDAGPLAYLLLGGEGRTEERKPARRGSASFLRGSILQLRGSPSSFAPRVAKLEAVISADTRDFLGRQQASEARLVDGGV
jgi:hypothetical protein